MRTKGTLLIALLSIAAFLAIAGCAKDPGMSNGSSQPATGGNPPPTSTGSGATGPLNLGPLKVKETADFGGLTYTLQEIQLTADGPNLQSGEVYVYAHFVIKNGTKDTVLVSSLNGFKLLDPAGKRFTKSMYGDNVKGPSLDQSVLAGKSVDGWVAFTPKQADGDFTIEVVPVLGGKATFKFALK